MLMSVGPMSVGPMSVGLMSVGTVVVAVLAAGCTSPTPVAAAPAVATTTPAESKSTPAATTTPAASTTPPGPDPRTCPARAGLQVVLQVVVDGSPSCSEAYDVVDGYDTEGPKVQVLGDGRWECESGTAAVRPQVLGCVAADGSAEFVVNEV